MYYLERKTEELERQGKKVEGKKSKPRGPNYEWTFDDNFSAIATKIIEQAREQDEAWSGGPVSTQARPLETFRLL